MSLASILDKISGDVEDSFSAVLNAGGTVPQETTLGNLAEAVATVPGEPIWEDPETAYGGLYYYSQWSASYSIDTETVWGCTVNSFNQTVYAAFVAENPPTEMMPGEGARFSYQENWEIGDGSYAWNYMGETGNLWIPQEDFATTTGIDVTLDEGATNADLSVTEAIAPTPNSPTAFVALANVYGLSELGNGNTTYSVGGVKIPNSVVRRFVFGTTPNVHFPSGFLSDSSVESISEDTHGALTTLAGVGGSFLTSCQNLRKTRISLPYLVDASLNFLYDCQNFNGTLNLPALTTIGGGFMIQCYSFNKPLTIPSTVTRIGYDFMRSCRSFNQEIVIPSSVVSIGAQFLNDCKNMVGPVVANVPATVFGTGTDNYTLGTDSASDPAYNPGITITGPYAADWKAHFPDRTIAPYRHLVVES